MFSKIVEIRGFKLSKPPFGERPPLVADLLVVYPTLFRCVRSMLLKKRDVERSEHRFGPGLGVRPELTLSDELFPVCIFVLICFFYLGKR